MNCNTDKNFIAVFWFKKNRLWDIYEAKVKLSEELAYYDKVKDNEQIKSLVDFLEYLFLIQDPELEKKYEEYRREKGGALKMTIEETDIAILKKWYKMIKENSHIIHYKMSCMAILIILERLLTSEGAKLEMF
ncbi:hypothetical protein [Clostridium gasigenes]|uniref:hypothetical protein n=1 Tax=Clostridium gasigenes TaxID=94869 RepID=UPI001FACD38B|nr:hypothetical protein [Clostridium gasigenes]